jgi:hypothetical protein
MTEVPVMLCLPYSKLLLIFTGAIEDIHIIETKKGADYRSFFD